MKSEKTIRCSRQTGMIEASWTDPTLIARYCRRWAVEEVAGKPLCLQHAQIARGERPYGPGTKRAPGGEKGR